MTTCPKCGCSVDRLFFEFIPNRMIEGELRLACLMCWCHDEFEKANASENSPSPSSKPGVLAVQGERH